MIPLMLDTSRLHVLVFGAGAVGIRKARYFAGNCQKLTIASREFSAEIAGADQKTCDIARMTRAELRHLIKSHDIIIAAVPDETLNKEICEAAAENGKWYNSATGGGNFLIPAAFSEGGATIAVSTGGKSPAAAAYIRDTLREACPSPDLMVKITADLREELKETEPDAEKRADILRRVLRDEKVREALAAGDEETARYRAWSIR
ncbi:MAG: bifunctional precorrin-2 dehydrogenase/sirohydrochlorin ferrochelatase [Methanocorpusculum sp.]|nr:bifunctional precorrin-2 dehydrogenase/sirohydrochlorin ferrochelatase [Methanocorpusculum sp.]